MGVFSEIFAVGSTSVSDLLNPRLWLEDWGNGRKTTSGAQVNAASANSLSAYYACKRVISEDVAKQPIKVFRKKGGDREPLPDHPVHRLLNETPNPDMIALVFREVMTSWAMGWGGAIAEIERDGRGVPLSLNPVHPNRVTIRRNAKKRIEYIVRNNDNTSVTLPQGDVFHLRGYGEDDLRGLSVLGAAAESIGLGLEAQAFGAAFFGNGAHLGSIITHPGTMKPESYENFRRTWGEAHAGASKAGGFAILEDGMTHENMSIPPEQAQFLVTRQFQNEEMARWFRITLHKIQHMVHATYSNIENLNDEYVNDSLMGWAIRWEQETKRKLLVGEKAVFIKHNFASLLRGNQKARSEFYSKLFNTGALNINEIMELEDKNGIGEVGDRRWINSNMQRADLEEEEEEPEEGVEPPGNEEPQEEPEEEEESIGQPEEEAPKERDALRVIDLDVAQQSQEALFWAAYRTAITKEINAAGRAAKKCKTPDEFSAWIQDFLNGDRGHKEYVRTLLAANYEAMAPIWKVASGFDVVPVAPYDCHVTGYGVHSREDLLEAFMCGPQYMEDLFKSWRETRAEQYAEWTARTVRRQIGFAKYEVVYHIDEESEASDGV